MPGPDPQTINEVYIDESSQTKHRYLLLGGIIINSESAEALTAIIEAARLPELPAGEMKWKKVSRTKLPAYCRVVDAFFNNADGLAPLHFHSLVVDTHRLNDRQHNGGSREVGFNKEIYQLCQKFGRLYRDRLFHIYPDHRDTSQDPNELRLILNGGIAKAGDQRDWPFRRVHLRDSSQLLPLQLVDILLGALAFRVNGHDRSPDASPAKLALSAHILRRAGITDVMRDTAIAGRYTIWHRRLR